MTTRSLYGGQAPKYTIAPDVGAAGTCMVSNGKDAASFSNPGTTSEVIFVVSDAGGAVGSGVADVWVQPLEVGGFWATISIRETSLSTVTPGTYMQIAWNLPVPRPLNGWATTLAVIDGPPGTLKTGTLIHNALGGTSDIYWSATTSAGDNGLLGMTLSFRGTATL